MKLSGIFGKRVFGTSGRQGYIISVHASECGGVFLRCADDKEREFFINCADIIRFGAKIVFEERETAADGPSLYIGKPCYDLFGDYLGGAAEYTAVGGKLKSVKIGKKNYPAEGLILGDIILVRASASLKSDVFKDGEVLFKKGEQVTAELLERAAVAGEYVQTKLKSL